MLVDTGSADAIVEADKLLPGGLFTTPTLDGILSQHGKTLFVASSASSGTTRLLHHQIEQGGDHLCLYGHDTAVSSPDGFGREIADWLGAPPLVDTPDIGAVEYEIDAFLGRIWPQNKPDVTLFWFNEPDIVYHAFGPLSAEAQLAINALDRQVGRLIDWWESEGRNEDVQLFIISDHGQIPTTGQIDVIAEMRAAGFDAGQGGDFGGEFLVIPGGFVQIYARDGQSTGKLLGWLQAQSWCGLTFVKGEAAGNLSSALPLAAGLYDNERAADLVFTFRDRVVNGFAATPYFKGNTYLGMHGGLSARETNAVNIMAGSKLNDPGRIAETPSSTADILPTLLACLDIIPPPEVSGRMLFDPTTGKLLESEWARETLTAGSSGYNQSLHRFRVGEHIYVDYGEVDQD